MQLFKSKSLEGSRGTLIAGERPDEVSANISKRKIFNLKFSGHQVTGGVVADIKHFNSMVAFSLKLLLVLVLSMTLMSVVFADEDDDGGAGTDWPFFNFDRESTGFIDKSGDLSVEAIEERGLVLKWKFGEDIEIQAPTVIHDGVGYLITSGDFGVITAIDIQTSGPDILWS